MKTFNDWYSDVGSTSTLPRAGTLPRTRTNAQQPLTAPPPAHNTTTTSTSRTAADGAFRHHNQPSNLTISKPVSESEQDVFKRLDNGQIEDFRDMSLDNLVKYLRDKSQQLTPKDDVSKSSFELSVARTSAAGTATGSHAPPERNDASDSTDHSRLPGDRTINNGAVPEAAGVTPVNGVKLPTYDDAIMTSSVPDYVMSTSESGPAIDLNSQFDATLAYVNSRSSERLGGAGYDVTTSGSELDRDYVERKYEEMKYWTLQRRRKPKHAAAATSAVGAAPLRAGHSEVSHWLSFVYVASRVDDCCRYIVLYSCDRRCGVSANRCTSCVFVS